MPEIIVVVIEYIPTQARVIVRGAWRKDEYKHPPPLLPDNQQNAVNVFLNVDMKHFIGFDGLVPGGV